MCSTPCSIALNRGKAASMLKELINFFQLRDPNAPIEQKIVYFLLIATFITATFGLTQNLVVGLYGFVNYMLVFVLIVSAFQFYLVLFVPQSRKVVLPFLTILGLTIGSTWFDNGGVRGSTLSTFMIYVIIGILLLNRRYIIIFIIATTLFVSGLFVYELQYPESIHLYESEWIRKLDLYNIFIVCMLFNGLAMGYYKVSYVKDRERLIEAKTNIEETQQQTLLAKEKAEKAEKAKTEFLTNMSHEIRTPLNAVIGSADLLETTSLSNDQKDLVETINISSRHLLNLVSHVLDMSRLEEGKLLLEHQDFQLDEVTESTIKLFANDPKIKSKALNLRLNIAPNTPNDLHGDPYRLRQILVNLIGNAIKFTEKGWVELRISAGESPLAGRIFLEFQVQDTGIGIQQEDQKQLFTPFTQLNSGQQNALGGAGLGLTITKTLVELMGGVIHLDSKPNQGTTFFFNALFNKGAAPAVLVEEPNVEYRLAERYPLKMLVAEDNALNQKLIQRIMNHLGYAIDLAENGREAIQRATLYQYDLILMDIQMPDLNGIEATQIIRKNKRMRPIIIAMTAGATLEDQEACLEAGMDDFVSKPVSVIKIKQLIHQWGKQTVQRN
jgi:signal transduction histidine kinase/CheY-like chemotaxis protein